jgi:putative AlgH/UPF0301 family transcriptional regulator
LTKEPYAQLTKGTFLIASPDINSGMYFRGVILLCEHGPTGSFGILINKVLDVEIPEEVIDMKDIANPRVQIRAGGPFAAEPDDAGAFERSAARSHPLNSAMASS